MFVFSKKRVLSKYTRTHAHGPAGCHVMYNSHINRRFSYDQRHHVAFRFRKETISCGFHVLRWFLGLSRLSGYSMNRQMRHHHLLLYLDDRRDLAKMLAMGFKREIRREKERQTERSGDRERERSSVLALALPLFLERLQRTAKPGESCTGCCSSKSTVK